MVAVPGLEGRLWPTGGQPIGRKCDKSVHARRGGQLELDLLECSLAEWPFHRPATDLLMACYPHAPWPKQALAP